ncbi:MAG: CPBP family intramembrane glutamic endopeptidase [Myxococcota bacterium]
MTSPLKEAPPFPSIGEAVALTLTATLIQAFLLLLLIASHGPRVAFSGMSTMVGFGVAFTLGAARLHGPPGGSLGFVRASPRVWIAVPFLLGTLLVTSELHNILVGLFPYPEEFEPMRPAGAAAILEWAVVLMLVLPAAEELFFRGLLQPGLVLRLGTWKGIALTALLHGLAAGLLRDPRSAPAIAGGALVLGFLRHSSGSLLPVLALSVLSGGVALLATLDFFGIPGFDDLSEAHTPLGWVVTGALSMGIGLLLCREDESAPSRPEEPTGE